MKYYNKKLGNLEFRTCNSNLLDSGKYVTGEIIQHGDNFCWTIAYWEHDESFDLRFVGSRPFDSNVGSRNFWKLAKIGQEYLEKSE